MKGRTALRVADLRSAEADVNYSEVAHMSGKVCENSGHKCLNLPRLHLHGRIRAFLLFTGFFFVRDINSNNNIHFSCLPVKPHLSSSAAPAGLR